MPKKSSKIKINLPNLNWKIIWKSIPYFLLTFILFISYKIRTVPIKNMQWVQALDPYWNLRLMATQLVHGSPTIDFFRLVPYATGNISRFLEGEIYFPAWLFSLFGKIFSLNLIQWAQIWPAIGGTLMVLAAFLMGKELKDSWTGVFSSFFMATVVGLLQRSSAGWLDKEATAGFLMLFTFYFLLRAWKRSSWLNGMVAGLFLGLASVTWGGANSYLFLLLPILSIVALLLNEKVEKIMAVFTPSLLLGSIFGMAFHSNFGFASSLFLIQIFALSAIWIKYLFAKYNWIEKKKINWVPWAFFAIVAVLLLLSPLYSQSLATKVDSIIGITNQGNTGIVGNTVAENSGASPEQVISQLSVVGSSSIPLLNKIANYFSPWTWSLVGLVFLTVELIFLLIKNFPSWKIKETTFYAFFVILSILSPFLIMVLFGKFAGRLFSVAFGPFLALSIIGGIVFVIFGKREGYKGHWSYLLIFIWIITSIYASTQRSRLMFVAAMPVAFVAGYGLRMFIQSVADLKVWDMLGSKIKKYIDVGFSAKLFGNIVFGILLVLFIYSAYSINYSNASNGASRIGGSPEQPWIPALNFMKENTSADSVILSWWDYGYWFETIGQRASTADGGGSSYIFEDGDILQEKLADFLTSNNYTEWLPWLKSMGVNYVVLDYTMIGKYSAVSQIHNRDNSKFSIMNTINFDKVITQNNQTFLSYCFKAGNRCQLGSPKLFLPANIQGSSMSVIGAPIFQDSSGQTLRFSKFCTPNGVVNFNVSGPIIPGCPHIDPLAGTQRLVLVSRNQNGQFQEEDVEATLVKLYLRDGNEMPEFEKVFDNRYVKMWKVNYPDWVDKELALYRSGQKEPPF